jgi:hypothetical protein
VNSRRDTLLASVRSKQFSCQILASIGKVIQSLDKSRLQYSSPCWRQHILYSTKIGAEAQQNLLTLLPSKSREPAALPGRLIQADSVVTLHFAVRVLVFVGLWANSLVFGCKSAVGEAFLHEACCCGPIQLLYCSCLVRGASSEAVTVTVKSIPNEKKGCTVPPSRSSLISGRDF